MRTPALLLPLCAALAPLRHPTRLQASTQPFVYDNAATLADRYAEYEAICTKAVADDATFATFKSEPAYQDVLEHVSYEVGRCYEHRLSVDYPALIADEGLRAAVTTSASLGSPTVFAYGEWGTCSPTQLRYLCVRGDLEKLCGSLEKLKIVEVGGGYGGQAQVCVAGQDAAKAYRVLDLPCVERLCRKYIQTALPERSKRFRTGRRFLRDWDVIQDSFDVFHSNFALSELPRHIQKPYVELAQRTPFGFVTWNHGIHPDAMNGTEFSKAMARRGRDVVVEAEVPLTAPGNLVVSWRPTPKVPKAKRNALKTLGLRVKYYGPSWFHIAAAALVLPVAQRLPLLNPGDVGRVATMWQGCRGGSARTDLAAQAFLASGPRQQVRTYEQLAFDARQRGLEVPSFLRFAHAAYKGVQQGQLPARQVPSPEAAARSVKEGSPLVCAALQDIEGNMAGEGKLLNIYWLLRRTVDLGIPGSVAELGCNRGVTAALLQSVLKAHRPGTDLHVYDSFEGLPQGTKEDPPAYQTAGAMACSPQDVRDTFSLLNLPAPTIHKGWFADLAATEVPSQISFAHVDGDLYASITDALTLIYDKLAPGAICVVDDVTDPEQLPRHGIFPGAHGACVDFLKGKPEKLEVLPAPHPTIDAVGGVGGYETHAYFQKV